MTDLRPWAKHNSDCPKAYTERWINILHREQHLDDTGMDSCHFAACRAWCVSKTPACACGLDAALTEPEPWNPDLTTAPRDARIKLQLPPYVTGHLNTVVSVEPIAWAPDEGSESR